MNRAYALGPLGPPSRGIAQTDVSHAADTLLRSGERPTIEKIRAKIGRGSPNTINPMLDTWWKTLSARLDSGPAALHRLPETIAHIAEALWMQPSRKATPPTLEQRHTARLAELDKHVSSYAPRPHPARRRTRLPPARSRPHHRIPELTPAELTGAPRQGTGHARITIQRITALETQLLARVPMRKLTTRTAHRPSQK